MRAYGYPITSLKFEQQVKVGSKIYRCDIVVLREGRPWIVVECKEPSFSQHESAFEQGQSYADIANNQAGYVLYANGVEWMVRRKINDVWMPVDDLPSWSQIEISHNFVDVLESVYDIKPVLFMLDEPLIDLDAKCFLDELGRFFNSSNLLLKSVDDSAIHASDHVLRVIIEKNHHANRDLIYDIGPVGRLQAPYVLTEDCLYQLLRVLQWPP
jgi:hypothetical protein